MTTNQAIKYLLDDCCIYYPLEKGQSGLNITELAGNLAYHAMMLEAHLTPKPGLVDCQSVGAHRDMDIHTFIASSEALRPYMKAFVIAGLRAAHLPSEQLLDCLRPIGMEAEKAMFTATSNVNTHKGMIFTLGLICGAVGWLYQNQLSYDAHAVRAVIKSSCAHLVESELKPQVSNRALTAGERIFQQYGLTGIRGEAAAGYPTIYDHALPAYRLAIEQGESEEKAMSLALFTLMANNSDTNVINRAGITGLELVQSQARQFLATQHSTHSAFEKHIVVLDALFVSHNISPGGSADLLAATWLLTQLDTCSKVLINK